MRSPQGFLLPLRAFLGVTFAFAGLQKLSNASFFRASSPSSFQAQLHGAILTSPIAPVLRVVAHAAVPIAVLIALCEVAVGVGTLLGLFGRLAATGGLLLSLSFFLTISWSTTPYYYGSDIVFCFAWSALALGGPSAYSLDAAYEAAAVSARAAVGESEAPAVERRLVIRRMATFGLVATFSALATATVTAVGRVLAPGQPSTAGAGASTSSASGPARLVARTRQVPVGGAIAFTDPLQNIPAYIVQPNAGVFRAFSAVCTHAGCTVAFDRSREAFVCPCHGSVYEASTGAVLAGPAPAPLPPIRLRERNGALYAED